MFVYARWRAGCLLVFDGHTLSQLTEQRVLKWKRMSLMRVFRASKCVRLEWL